MHVGHVGCVFPVGVVIITIVWLRCVQSHGPAHGLLFYSVIRLRNRSILSSIKSINAQENIDAHLILFVVALGLLSTYLLPGGALLDLALVGLSHLIKLPVPRLDLLLQGLHALRQHRALLPHLIQRLGLRGGYDK